MSLLEERRGSFLQAYRKAPTPGAGCLSRGHGDRVRARVVPGRSRVHAALGWGRSGVSSRRVGRYRSV